MPKLLVITFSFGYLALLFGVAYAAERRSAARKSLVANPYVYALSMAVYCTAWTFYGSVGRAASSGLEFVGIYLGPTLLAPAWWLVLRKIIRISRQQRLTSIADFLSARYGKSAALGALVTVVYVLGVVPYIALQIKAIAASFDILTRPVGTAIGPALASGAAANSALITTAALAFFTIIFGVRSLETTERHEGMVLAVALESLVKLAAFLAAGIFVVWGLFGGLTDVFDHAAAQPALARLFTLGGAGTTGPQWATLLLLSASAIVLLPRQFQVAVVENVDENHLRKAMWLFPLYLVVINLLVLPVAFAGELLLGGRGLDADTYVLALPLYAGHAWLALAVYIGGLSAASSMIIVETVALSVLVSNHLLMPLLVRVPATAPAAQGRWFAYLGQAALGSRRVAVVLVLALAYGYYRAVALALPLVNIGLVSFAAVAQFVPVLLGALYWKGGTRRGATAGIAAGFAVWFFTLVLPTVPGPGGQPLALLRDGLLGMEMLRPFALFGLTSLDHLSHSLFWSWLLNVGCFVGVSLWQQPSALEARQADVFVDVFSRQPLAEPAPGWRSAATLPALRELLTGFLGKRRATQALRTFAERHPAELPPAWLHWHAALPGPPPTPPPALLAHAEILLAGSVGPASARLLLASAVGAEEISFDNVVVILEESRHLLEANRQLDKQSRRLQRLTDELRQAYAQLQALDQRKNEFLSTVTHELRTPLTSIRALAEILTDHDDLDPDERQRFGLTISKEAERLSRLIALVLDLEKYESGTAVLQLAPVDLPSLVADAFAAVAALAHERRVALGTDLPADLPALLADRDRLMQVLVNLLSNALKACPADGTGRVAVLAWPVANALLICVEDNGKGVAAPSHNLIFDKFYQAHQQTTRKPEGTGLGLAISRQIVELHKGRIWVESAAGQGARFFVELPL